MSVNYVEKTPIVKTSVFSVTDRTLSSIAQIEFRVCEHRRSSANQFQSVFFYSLEMRFKFSEDRPRLNPHINNRPHSNWYAIESSDSIEEITGVINFVGRNPQIATKILSDIVRIPEV